MNDYTQEESDERQRILNNIEKYGCHLITIEADNYMPAFVYSIGLYQRFRHPEIVCFGLSTELMAGLINDACYLIKNGMELRPQNRYSEFIEGNDVQFLSVDKEYYKDYLGYARWFYNKSLDFPAIQLVWPDKQQNFPWDAKFNQQWKYKQPLLDRNTDFKFHEDRKLRVFTTKSALEGGTVLYVYHNEDGDWQFHTSLDPQSEDARIVTFENIIQTDPTLNEIFHLQFGWWAWRESKEDGWRYEKHRDGHS